MCRGIVGLAASPKEASLSALEAFQHIQLGQHSCALIIIARKLFYLEFSNDRTDFPRRSEMRLLDARALVYDNIARLAEYPDASQAPRYAILSHTWENEEVLFEDIGLGPQYEVPDELEDYFPIRAADDDYDSDVQSTGSMFSSAASMDSQSAHVKAGWNKVLNTCLLAVRDGFRYVWIDTCTCVSVL